MAKDNITIQSPITESVSVDSAITKEIAIDSAITTSLTIQSPIGIEGEAGFTPEFQAIYDEWIIKPEDFDALLWNQEVSDLIDSGKWATLDRFFFFAIHTNDNGEALLDWKNPTTNSATMVNNPTFIAFEGFNGDALTKYIDSNFAPSVDGVNYTLNDAGVFIYIRTSIVALQSEFGAGDIGFTNITQINAIQGGLGQLVRINSNTFSSNLSVDATGMYFLERLNSTDQDFYKNKVKVIDSSVGSNGITSNNFFILGFNNNGVLLSPSSKQISCVGITDGYNQTDVDNVTDAVETVMDAKGKGVIT